MRETAVPSESASRSLIGTWRWFGPTGPAYEVIATGPVTEAGDQLMRVRVAETGEELDYPLRDILHDHDAA